MKLNSFTRDLQQNKHAHRSDRRVPTVGGRLVPANQNPYFSFWRIWLKIRVLSPLDRSGALPTTRRAVRSLSPMLWHRPSAFSIELSPYGVIPTRFPSKILATGQPSVHFERNNWIWWNLEL